MSKQENVNPDGIDVIAKALSKAQGEMTNAVKDKKNPFFKSSYADLGDVFQACRKALYDNNLSVTQVVEIRDNYQVLVTRLMHESGQQISSEMIVPPNNDIQKLGSSLTYLRRYSLMGIMGIAAVEDDGNAAVVDAASIAKAKATLNKQEQAIEYINEAQALELGKLLHGNTQLLQDTLRFAKADSLTKIPLALFEKIKTTIERHANASE